MELPICPKCKSEFTYEDRDKMVCSSCFHEWVSTKEKLIVYKDVNGNELVDGDDVVTIKDLKINKGSEVIKIGSKGKDIKLGEFHDNHDIVCKIKGFGVIYLKTSLVKKSK